MQTDLLVNLSSSYEPLVALVLSMHDNGWKDNGEKIGKQTCKNNDAFVVV